MMKKNKSRYVSVLLSAIAVAVICALFVADIAEGSSEEAEVKSVQVDIYSDGTRLSGDVFYPPAAKLGKKYPAIVMCQGWGGVRKHSNKSYAPYFARAGYVVLTFDYRGWGDSDSRLIIKGDMPKPDENGEVTVKAQAIRELVDPLDQTEDIINSISFISGDPKVDRDRIGLWGTSYGGGHVLYVATHDSRVKCIVSQVPSMESSLIVTAAGGKKMAEKKAIQRARAEIDPVPQGFEVFRSLLYVTGLKGTPYISRMAAYRPVEYAEQLTVPILIIAAKKDELIDNEKNGGLVYEKVKQNVPARYEMFNMSHFEIYSEGLEQARGMAIEWFDKHLK